MCFQIVFCALLFSARGGKSFRPTGRIWLFLYKLVPGHLANAHVLSATRAPLMETVWAHPASSASDSGRACFRRCISAASRPRCGTKPGGESACATLVVALPWRRRRCVCAERGTSIVDGHCFRAAGFLGRSGDGGWLSDTEACWPSRLANPGDVWSCARSRWWACCRQPASAPKYLCRGRCLTRVQSFGQHYGFDRPS